VFSGSEIYAGIIYPREHFMGFLECVRNPADSVSQSSKIKFRKFIPLMMVITSDEPRHSSPRRWLDIIIAGEETVFDIQATMSGIFQEVDETYSISEWSEAIIPINKFFTT
jgi:hypothetical protein